MKVVVVGAGIAGATAACLLTQVGHNVEVFETRDHIGGNCYDSYDPIADAHIHEYGPHIFHTFNKEIWDFVNTHSVFLPYEHTVAANTDLGLISIPYNKLTEAQLGGGLTDDEIKKYIFKDYSEKHWGQPFKTIPNTVLSRVNLRRDSWDNRYFPNQFQGIPKYGYTELIKSMLSGSNVHLGVYPHDWRKYKFDLIIFTGPIDSYFDYSLGYLPYRSLELKFVREQRDTNRLASVINECNKKVSFTRSTDYSWFYSSNKFSTVVSYEYPCEYDGNNIPYYPKLNKEALLTYRKYNEKAQKLKNVFFVGRLASFKYMDMDACIGQTINTINKML